MTAYEFGQWEAREGEPFNPGSYFVLESEMTAYASGFLSVQPDNYAVHAFLSGDAPECGVETATLTYVDESSEFTAAQYEYLRSRDLAVDAAQSRPDDWTAAQRDAAPVAERPQLREDDGEIIFAF